MPPKTIPFDASNIPQTIPFGQESFSLTNQPQQSLADRIWSGLATTGNVLGSIFPGKRIGEALGTSIVGASALLQGKTLTQAQEAMGGQVSPLRVGGDVLQAVALPASLAMGAPTAATALGRIGQAGLQGATTGAALSGGKSLAEGAAPMEAGKSALVGGALGGGIGAGAQGIVESIPLIQKGLNKLLTHTSNTPEEVFKILERKPEAIAQIGISPQEALKNTQKVTRGLRTSLTQEWKDGVNNIANEFSGKAVGLPDKTLSLLEKVDDVVGGLEHIPQNTASMSAKELIELSSEVNGIANKTAFKITPQGVPIRKLADELKNLGVKTFGGDTGSYATLYSNYATKKAVLDAANQIVSAYKLGNPINQTTALNRLQTIFNENRPAYLEAIKGLEAATGKDILSEIAASKVQNILPRFKAIHGDIFDKTIKILALPLTSPRSAAFLARTLPKTISNVSKIGAKIITPAVSSLVSTKENPK